MYVLRWLPFRRRRLTLPTGGPPGQRHAYHSFQRDVIIQNESGPVGIGTAGSTFWLCHPFVPNIQTHPPWYTGPLNYCGELEGPNEPFLSDVGGSPNAVVTVGYSDSSPGGIWLGGDFPRYDASPGGPIHLTTSISMASSQVSQSRLAQEACRR